MSELSSLLQKAKQNYTLGKMQEARLNLSQAVRLDPQNPKIWIALAKVSETPEDALQTLKRAQKYHPQNEAILRAKEKLEAKVMASRLTSGVIKRPFIFAIAGCVAAFLLITAVFSWNRPQTTLQVQPVAAQAIAESTPQPIIETATPTAPALSGKQIVAKDAARATWTVTPTPSPTPTNTPTVIPTFVSSTAYTSEIRPFGVSNTDRWIDINLSTQVLKAYEGDQLVFSTLISSGTSEHRTVTGQFRIWLRFQSQTMDGTRLGYDYYLENVPYVMYFFEDYAIHGAYWHNNFGQPMSHGCVNMDTEDANWLYNWASLGTVVNVHY